MSGARHHGRACPRPPSRVRSSPAPRADRRLRPGDPGASVPERPSRDVRSCRNVSPPTAARTRGRSAGRRRRRGVRAAGMGWWRSGRGWPVRCCSARRFPMNPLPVQPAKIHCPPRRGRHPVPRAAQLLAGPAAAGRLGLIVAEAGFGKTHPARRLGGITRRRTAWYRLEPDDRDWLTFIRHLVAAGREIDPEFAPDTFRHAARARPGRSHADRTSPSASRARWRSSVPAAPAG